MSILPETVLVESIQPSPISSSSILEFLKYYKRIKEITRFDLGYFREVELMEYTINVP